MLIFGLTGPIRHGKSTFAKAVAKIDPKTIHFESSDIIAEVVNDWHATLKEPPTMNDVGSANDWIAKLPPILKNRVHLDINEVDLLIKPENYRAHPVEYSKLFMHIETLNRNPDLAKQKITEANKELYRPILQWVGGYLAHKSRGIWYKEIARRVQSAEVQGYNICLVGGLRFPNDASVLQDMGGKIIKIYRPGYLANDILDPTERERESIPVDCVVVSNGGIEDVENVAKRVIADTINGQLKSEYTATTA